VSFRDHTQAVIDALTEAGLRVTDNEPDSTMGRQSATSFHPYLFVRQSAGSRIRVDADSGSLASDGDVFAVVQVDAVASTPEGAERLADQARAVIEAGITVGERATLKTYHDVGLGCLPDENVNDRRWRQVDRYRIDTTPA